MNEADLFNIDTEVEWKTLLDNPRVRERVEELRAEAREGKRPSASGLTASDLLEQAREYARTLGTRR